MTGWQRFEVEERARRYGQVRRFAREAYPPITEPAPEPQPIPALARDDVAACA